MNEEKKKATNLWFQIKIGLLMQNDPQIGPQIMFQVLMKAEISTYYTAFR